MLKICVKIINLLSYIANYVFTEKCIWNSNNTNNNNNKFI